MASVASSWRRAFDARARRSEFAAILKSRGIDGLIAAFNRKADILIATTAKASWLLSQAPAVPKRQEVTGAQAACVGKLHRARCGNCYSPGTRVVAGR
jgi:uroporphyrinogen-III synthase